MSLRVEALVTVLDGVLEFRIAAPLKSPNDTRGGHWSIRHAETKRWQRLIVSAFGHAWQHEWLLTAVGTLVRTQERRRVTVICQRPSRRNFCKDDDNRRYLAKPVNDALKRIGLLYDDSRRWLEQPMPEEQVSEDGADWTVIRIERLPLLATTKGTTRHGR